MRRAAIIFVAILFWCHCSEWLRPKRLRKHVFRSLRGGSSLGIASASSLGKFVQEEHSQTNIPNGTTAGVLSGIGETFEAISRGSPFLSQISQSLTAKSQQSVSAVSEEQQLIAPSPAHQEMLLSESVSCDQCSDGEHSCVNTTSLQMQPRKSKEIENKQVDRPKDKAKSSSDNLKSERNKHERHRKPSHDRPTRVREKHSRRDASRSRSHRRKYRRSRRASSRSYYSSEEDVSRTRKKRRNRYRHGRSKSRRTKRRTDRRRDRRERKHPRKRIESSYSYEYYTETESDIEIEKKSRDRKKTDSRDSRRRDKVLEKEDRQYIRSVNTSEMEASYQKKLYVGGIPPDTREIELRTFFDPYGEITDIFLPKSKVRTTHYAFVEFSTVSEAKKAAQDKFGAIFKGCRLLVTHAKPKMPRIPTTGPKNRLFVGGFPNSITKAEVGNLFGVYGNIERIYLKTSPLPGTNSFAIITYENFKQAKEAVDAWIGREYEGNYLRVDFAGKPPEKARRDDA
mmetsp:Transcript_4477/g.6696  ORF Transcript_4477/g.6696 Transcript_4477/m.6696 type:complete len:511 (-) Transcript_4477:52-1584(-)|eukprot:CAMPEP_0167741518 /NCGR_PEP_ID=MMETSP0110_2-20121227/901_1 /TAXON_ID=629695 /ORGANISM="Gymnochlora sp., Strain CCMP2014" /LENGTH=510 /DNA_ID=CAMNT_0007625579 /DNA_START=939 /DNA_END=2471 /DNA_ORIENTATION=+